MDTQPKQPGQHPSHPRQEGHKSSRKRKRKAAPIERDPFVRAENEDDDGYDPYSDRQPRPEPLFERDPWS